MARTNADVNEKTEELARTNAEVNEKTELLAVRNDARIRAELLSEERGLEVTEMAVVRGPPNENYEPGEEIKIIEGKPP